MSDRDKASREMYAYEILRGLILEKQKELDGLLAILGRIESVVPTSAEDQNIAAVLKCFGGALR
jgi:hypothetical protein